MVVWVGVKSLITANKGPDGWVSNRMSNPEVNDFFRQSQIGACVVCIDNDLTVPVPYDDARGREIGGKAGPSLSHPLANKQRTHAKSR